MSTCVTGFSVPSTITTDHGQQIESDLEKFTEVAWYTAYNLSSHCKWFQGMILPPAQGYQSQPACTEILPLVLLGQTCMKKVTTELTCRSC